MAGSDLNKTYNITAWSF